MYFSDTCESRTEDLGYFSFGRRSRTASHGIHRYEIAQAAVAYNGGLRRVLQLFTN